MYVFLGVSKVVLVIVAGFYNDSPVWRLGKMEQNVSTPIFLMLSKDVTLSTAYSESFFANGPFFGRDHPYRIPMRLVFKPYILQKIELRRLVERSVQPNDGPAGKELLDLDRRFYNDDNDDYPDSGNRPTAAINTQINNTKPKPKTGRIRWARVLLPLAIIGKFTRRSNPNKRRGTKVPLRGMPGGRVGGPWRAKTLRTTALEKAD